MTQANKNNKNHNHISDALLTLIVCIQAGPNRPDLLTRLEHLKQDPSLDRSKINVLIVDFASPNEPEVRSQVGRLGFDYLRVNCLGGKFNISAARNAGAAHAKTPWLLFLDVDLIAPVGLFGKILVEMQTQRLAKNHKAFLMFPVLYLTERGSAQLCGPIDYAMQSRLHQDWLDQSFILTEKYSSGTSVILIHRTQYHRLGGHSEDFEQWGYEDLEFNCRAIHDHGGFLKPANPQSMQYNFNSVNAYESWKAPYRLYGDVSAAKGLVFFHKWHPVDGGSSYMANKDRNRSLFKAKHAQTLQAKLPIPIGLPECGQSIVLTANPFTMARTLLPFMGQVIRCRVPNVQNLRALLLEYPAARVVFFNPYANEDLLDCYDYVRSERQPYWVIERGALANSLFIDSGGFNADSHSYEEFQGLELSSEQEFATREKINEYFGKSQYLESQPELIGPSLLRERLGLAGSKVLFVALQRPQDTVIKYLSDGADHFNRMVQQLELPTDWSIVAKKHPLEDQSPDLGSNVQYSDACIDDLLNLADAVLTINSGVGLLSVLKGKPTLVAGQAFYAQIGLAIRVQTPDQVRSGLNQAPESKTVLKFAHFLFEKFYSFASFETREVLLDGGRMTATTEVDIHELRIGGQLVFQSQTTDPVPWSSPLYDRYKAAGVSVVDPRNSGSKFDRLKESRSYKKLRKLIKNPVRFVKDSRWVKNR